MAEEKVKEIKGGPGGRRYAGPKVKVENAGQIFKRIMGYVGKRYKFQYALEIGRASCRERVYVLV